MRVPAKPKQRRMVLQSVSRHGRKRRYEELEEEVVPLTLGPSGEALPPSRSEIHPRALCASSQQSEIAQDQSVVRRSNRIKKKKTDNSYVYF